MSFTPRDVFAIVLCDYHWTLDRITAEFGDEEALKVSEMLAKAHIPPGDRLWVVQRLLPKHVCDDFVLKHLKRIDGWPGKTDQAIKQRLRDAKEWSVCPVWEVYHYYQHIMGSEGHAAHFMVELYEYVRDWENQQ